MKKFIMVFAAVCSLTFSGLLTTGCQYDDTGIWNEIDNVKNELKALQDQVGQMQAIVSKLSENKGIVSAAETDNGYLITFTDHTSLLLRHGNDGKDGADGEDGSRIGVKSSDGIWYWTVDGDFLLADGEKVPVTGNDGQDGAAGHTPVLDIDPEGFWCVDGVRIESDGHAVPAQGDSFFKNVAVENGQVIFTLADGSLFTVPMSGVCKLVIQAPEKVLVRAFTDPTVLQYEADGMSFVGIDSVPDGYDVRVDEEKKTITIKTTDIYRIKNGSRLVLYGADQNGQAYLSSVKLYVNTLEKADFVVLNEGWFGHEGATLNAYYDGIWDLRLYQNFNQGEQLGTTGVCAKQWFDFIYVVCKDGRNVTQMDMYSAYPYSALELGAGEQAQDIVFLNEETGYLSTTEALYEINLKPLRIIRKIFDGNVTDLNLNVKQLFFIHDQQLYAKDRMEEGDPIRLGSATTGFTRIGYDTWAADGSQLKRIDARTNQVDSVDVKCEVSVNPWAYTTTCLQSHGSDIYFTSGKSIMKFNTLTEEVDTFWTQPEGREFYGAGFAIRPYYGEIYAISKKEGWGENGKDFKIFRINPDGELLETIVYTDVDNTFWFPCQIFFPTKIG